jgi:lipopolysaccharide transport system ATP-binding protein
MSTTAISVKNLGKAYRIGLKEQQHETMLGAVAAWVKSPFRNFREVRNLGRFLDATTESASQLSAFSPQPSSDIVWALKGVSFEVKDGEAVGIIGRNGAGKSTLLKILSRITEPTSGRAEIHGRVASLLEVGTGFHQDLTGRENVFLNGTILGMKKREVEARFDRIVDFSGVGKFIDTPVKRYSSGMRVRLAFSVAAHLEPDILIVDEVLAVGDAEFQKKCLRKMQDVAGRGRTVLFVSHNMPSITRLCTRVVLLKDGQVVKDGEPGTVVGEYMRDGSIQPAERIWHDAENAPGDARVRIKAVRVLARGETVSEVHDIRDPVVVEVEYLMIDPTPPMTVAIHLSNEEGQVLFASNDFNNSEWFHFSKPRGHVRSRCHLPGNFLAEGRHYIRAALCTYNPNVVHASVEEAASFQIIDQSQGDGVRGHYSGGQWPGLVRPMLQWKAEMTDVAGNRVFSDIDL